MSYPEHYFMNRYEMEDWTDRAFQEHQFKAYYQPQFNHATGRIVGAEALVRWIHPEYGMQSPGDFIPVFESNGTITRLDLYIFEETCRFLRKCLDEKIRVVPISFNVSRHDIYCYDFISNMEKIRNTYQIPVKYLRVEITESAAANDNDYINKIVGKFHELGYVVEMDDFGSGYSSLNALKDIEVDIIKLDMAFLRGKIGGRGGIIISSIVRMANWLGTPVIVEGVETQEQADYMRSIGCEYIQGYFYSRPIPEQDFYEKLKHNKTSRTIPAMKLIDTMDAEKFWNPASLETMIFNQFVGGAAIFCYESDKDSIEMLRVNEKYLAELGMNMTQKEIILKNTDLNLDRINKKIYTDTIRRAIASGKEEECETWRKVYSSCCGEDELCIHSSLRVIGQADNRYLIYVMIRDMTKEKKAYEELYASEKKFRTASEHAKIYCWEYMIDTHEMRPCARCQRDLGLPKVLYNYPEPMIESRLFQPDYADLYREWHKQLDNGAEGMEMIMPLTDDRVPYHVRYTAEFDENGHPYKAYGSATLAIDLSLKDIY